MKALKDNLKELRKNNNFTLKDISKKLNVALSTYNGYELGNNLPTIFYGSNHSRYLSSLC